MANELTITKERVLEAASKCLTTKEVLTTLFPEVFENEFNLVNLKGTYTLFSGIEAMSAGFDGNGFMMVRSVDDEGLRDKAFYLDGRFVNWELRRTADGQHYILIPTRKQ